MFISFFEEFPELVSSEFRNVFISDNGADYPIPPGNYAFLELFCQDIDCDCRNVMIAVISSDPPKRWAVLRYGWESKRFYKKWFSGDNELAQHFPGVFLDTGMSPRNAMSQAFLTLFKQMIRNDPGYAKRIEVHYDLFKEKIQAKQMQQTPESDLITTRKSADKPKRNDLCPCNSGQKFKKCCLRALN